MNAIWVQVQDPVWVFTAIFVGLVVGVVSGYVKDWLSRGLAAFSRRYRLHADAKRVRADALMDDLKFNPQLLIIEYMRTLFGLGASLTLLSGSFFVPAWNALRKAFPDVDLTVSVLGLQPAVNDAFGAAASIVALVGGLYFWAHFQSKLRFCERARKEVRKQIRAARTS